MLVHSNTKMFLPDESSSKTPKSNFGSRRREMISNSFISSTPDLSTFCKLQNFEPMAKPKAQSFNLQFPNDDHFAREVSKDGNLSLSVEGIGGTYLVKGRDKKCIAVFKPGDEEAGAPSNPKKNMTSPRKGIKPGEGYIREVAAYLLDHGHYSGVPYTQFMELDVSGEKKMGSLQKYIPNDGSIIDFGQSLFSVTDVHKIAQLDIRLFNVDRNDENLLVTNVNGVYHLVPIDHSYSLPETLEDGPLFAWMFWKQAKMPMSEEVLEYIEKIDIEKDEKILRMLNFKEESIMIMKMSSLVLKVGARAGLSFYDIALFLTRGSKKERSALEEMVKDIMLRGDLEHFWENFMNVLYEKIGKK